MKLKSTIPFLLLITIMIGCNKEDEEENDDVNQIYKQEMREFVQAISQYAKSINNQFIIIPQNGQELVTVDGDDHGDANITYLNAIDGVGREDLYYGYDYDNQATPPIEISYMEAFLDICVQNNVMVLVTDYCSTHSKMDDSYNRSNAKGYISFAAPDRELNFIPNYPASPYNENSMDINSIADAKNFLYLLNPELFPNTDDFVSAIAETNYDIIIMDLFFTENEQFSQDDINNLKVKKNGGERLVLAYMSIGEAEDYRYYWNDNWESNPPEWLENENPDWPGNYIVRYWNEGWQKIIYGSNSAYLDRILHAGFDGAYLDIIDAFEYFE